MTKVAVRLKFDLETLNSFSSEISAISAELSELHTDTQDQLKELRTKWNTPAGKEFFEKQNTDWSSTVQDYVKILETLKEMIDYASEQYGEVQRLAEALSIQ